MQRFLASAFGKQAALGLALVLAAALAAVLFNFLGVITCAALVGLLTGATRQWRWQLLLASLVFPAAIIAYLTGWQTDISAHKTLLMAVVCFGTFWATYLATFAVLYFEKAGGADLTNEAHRLAAGLAPGDDTAVGAKDARATMAVDPMSPTDFEELQGAWAREIAGADGQGYRKVIEVKRNQVALSIVTGDGQVRCRAFAGLTLERVGPFKLLRICPPKVVAPLRDAQPSDFPAAGIYRVAGGFLTLAENLEVTANGCPPVLETYAKTGALALGPAESQEQ